MTSSEIAGIAVTSAAVLATIAGIIKNWEVIKDWISKIRVKRMVRFAQRQHPYCASVCTAPANMKTIMLRLDQMFEFIQVTREVSLETHGLILIDKCKAAIDRGYVSQLEKDEIIHSFIPYVRASGNGKVFYYVGMAMNLPTHEGGNSMEVDLNEILTREMGKFDHKRRSSDI